MTNFTVGEVLTQREREARHEVCFLFLSLSLICTMYKFLTVHMFRALAICVTRLTRRRTRAVLRTVQVRSSRGTVDTLFIMTSGCGMSFEGTGAEVHAAFERAVLPESR
jgi:hypothetical protein